MPTNELVIAVCGCWEGYHYRHHISHIVGGSVEPRRKLEFFFHITPRSRARVWNNRITESSTSNRILIFQSLRYLFDLIGFLLALPDIVYEWENQKKRNNNCNTIFYIFISLWNELTVRKDSKSSDLWLSIFLPNFYFSSWSTDFAMMFHKLLLSDNYFYNGP